MKSARSRLPNSYRNYSKEKRQERGKKAVSNSVPSIAPCVRCAACCRLGVEWGVVDSAPKVRMLAGERHRERVITASEEAKYLAAGNDLLHDVSVVLFDTGMRPEECHRMKW